MAYQKGMLGPRRKHLTVPKDRPHYPCPNSGGAFAGLHWGKERRLKREEMSNKGKRRQEIAARYGKISRKEIIVDMASAERPKAFQKKS